MDVFLMIQLIGFAAFALETLSCQAKSGRKVVLINVPSLILWAIHYMMLGGMTGAILCLLTAGRSLLCLTCPPAYHKHVFGIGLLAICAVCMVTWDGNISLLPFLGSVSFCFSVLRPDSGLWVRLSWMSSTFFWLLYGLAIGSMPEILASSIGLGSVAIALYRHDLAIVSRKLKAA